MHLSKGYTPCLIPITTFTTTIPMARAATTLATKAGPVVVRAMKTAPVAVVRVVMAMGRTLSATVPTSANACSKRAASSCWRCT